MKNKGFRYHPNIIVFLLGYFALVATLVNAQGIYPSNNPPGVVPVSVTPGMDPTLVPTYVGGDAAGPNDLGVNGSGTGIGGSNDNGNANTGGVQVQNVTVQSNPDQAQSTQLNSDINNDAYNGFHSARNLRVNTENAHNALILQKLENERLKSEWRRRGQIENFGQGPSIPPVYEGGSYPAPAINIYGAAASAAAGPGAEASNDINLSGDGVETVEVASVGSAAGSSLYTGNPPPRQSAFSIYPFAGKRWFSGVDTIADVNNQYIFGVGVEGRISNVFSLEAIFTYGADDFSGRGFRNGFYYNIGDAGRESYEFQANAKLGKRMGSLRPFGVLGLGYLYQSYDIDHPGVVDFMNRLGWDRSTTNVFSNIGAGADVFLSEGMSVGLRADYQHVFETDRYAGMNEWWGDNANRLRASANLNIVF